jgi:hypothetical protein
MCNDHNVHHLWFKPAVKFVTVLSRLRYRAELCSYRTPLRLTLQRVLCVPGLHLNLISVRRDAHWR